jgi:hypothetical protein
MGWECGTYGEKGNTYGVLVGKPEEREHWKDLGLDGSILLKGNLNRTGRHGLDLCGSGGDLLAD